MVVFIPSLWYNNRYIWSSFVGCPPVFTGRRPFHRPANRRKTLFGERTVLRVGKSIAKNTFFKFLLSVFNIIIPVIVGPYVNRVLGMDQVELYNSAVTMLNFFLIFATFGVYNYGIREINKVRDDKKALSQLFTNLFCFGLITSLLTSVFFGAYILFAVKADEQLVFSVMIIQVLANIFMVEWLNEALENYGFITMKTVIVRIISTVLLFLVVRHPEDAFLYAALMSVTVMVNNLVSFFYVKRQIPFDRSNLHIVRYIKPLFIMLVIANVNYLYTQLDRQFLLAGNVEGAVSNYMLPSNLINMILLVVQSFLLASVPRLSYYTSHGREEEYMALLDKSSRSYFMLVYPVCIGLFCLSYEAMYIYGSAKWVETSYQVLQVFSLRCIITSVYAVFTNQIMYLKNQEKNMVKILGFGGGLNLLFDALLFATGALTPVTAIASTGVAELIMLSVMYWFIRRRMRVEFHLFSFRNMKYLYYSLPFLPIVWGIRQFQLGVIPTSILAVGACGLYYGLLLLLTRDETLFFFLDKLRGKFHRS